LRTAAGNQRATQTAKATGGSRAGTIKGRVTRNPAAGAKLAAAGKGNAGLTGKGKAPSSRLIKPVKQPDGSFDVNGRPAKTMGDATRVLRQQRMQEKERALSTKRNDGTRKAERVALMSVERGTGAKANNQYARGLAVNRLDGKRQQVSDRIKKIAEQGRSAQNEYNKLIRKPTKSSGRQLANLKTKLTKLKKSMNTLQNAERSYSERQLTQRRAEANARPVRARRR
jgi:uncharacterized membrane-anchored protein YhcB (DUF1043 family)